MQGTRLRGYGLVVVAFTATAAAYFVVLSAGLNSDWPPQPSIQNETETDTSVGTKETSLGVRLLRFGAVTLPLIAAGSALVVRSSFNAFVTRTVAAVLLAGLTLFLMFASVTALLLGALATALMAWAAVLARLAGTHTS